MPVIGRGALLLFVSVAGVAAVLLTGGADKGAPAVELASPPVLPPSVAEVRALCSTQSAPVAAVLASSAAASQALGVVTEADETGTTTAAAAAHLSPHGALPTAPNVEDERSPTSAPAVRVATLESPVVAGVAEAAAEGSSSGPPSPPPPPPVALAQTFAKSLGSAINESRWQPSSQLACASPVVCVRGLACAPSPRVPASGDEAASCTAGWRLPMLHHVPLFRPDLDAPPSQGAPRRRSALVEVGTNDMPEASKLPKRPGRYTVAVEPLWREGRSLWSSGLADVFVSAAVAEARGVITLTADERMTSLRQTSSNAAAEGSKPTQLAPLVPLSEVVEAVVPRDVDAFALIVDAQGFDTAVVLSAGAEQLKRFRYVVIECQELWPEHPDRYNPTSLNCTGAIEVLTGGSWRHQFDKAAPKAENQPSTDNGGTSTSIRPGLRFVGCTRNAARLEYNCLFANRNDAVMADRKALKAATEELVEHMNAPGLYSDAEKRDAYGSGTVHALHAFVPSFDEAADLAVMMCPMWNQTERLRPNCGLQTDPQQLLHTSARRAACVKWNAECSLLRARCKKAFAKHCGARSAWKLPPNKPNPAKAKAAVKRSA